ncbi:MAG TPA: flagellar basal body rod protein FlgB [bacterium]|nr:flagellar basal body rod protein FlgB [bacterium]
MVNPVVPIDPLMVLQKSLDSLAIQHEAIANNLANIDTPQFKRTVVSFQDKLKNALEVNPPSDLWRTNPMHFPMAKPISLDHFQPDSRTITETIGRNDGNNVDLEMESGVLAENNLLYNSLVDVTSRYMANLRHSITEGKQ